MYTRLYLKRTRKNYNEILDSVTKETENLMNKFPEITMYKMIYDQLLDVKSEIITNNKIFSENNLYNRYNFGAIAAKNFDLEKDEYAQKLSDCFGGTFDYHTMPEK